MKRFLFSILEPDTVFYLAAKYSWYNIENTSVISEARLHVKSMLGVNRCVHVNLLKVISLTINSLWNFLEEMSGKFAVYFSSNKGGKRCLMQVESLPLTLEIFIRWHLFWSQIDNNIWHWGHRPAYDIIASARKIVFWITSKLPFNS